MINQNDVFSRWTVIGLSKTKGNHKYYFCQCECNTIKEVSASNLVGGKSKSCGCLKSVPNKIVKIKDKNYARLIITNPKTLEETITYIDKIDIPLVNQYQWYIRSDGYLGSKKEGINIFIHRLIMGIEDERQIDHRDNKRINNRRNNLRISTQTQNMQNRIKSSNKSSKYKGVCFMKKKYRASITFNKQVMFLGYFKKELDAAIAYNNKAIELFGEFAKLNQI